MTEPPLHRGHATVRQTTFVALDWQVAQLQRFDTVGDIIRRVPSRPGVYVLEGARDGQVAPSVLYIGQSGGRAGDRNRRQLSQRVRESLRRVLRSTRDADAPAPWSNYWDLVLRWAELDAEWVVPVEALLIRAHTPPLNSQHVRGTWLPPTNDLVVLNVGTKGPLLPATTSHYFRDDCWRGDETAETVEPGAEALTTPDAEAGEVQPLDTALDAFRRRYILDAIARCKGNRTHAARMLGVDPRTVFRYLEAEVKDGGKE